MKNTEKNLDDIIFEKRNKTYGAYALRKSYSRNLIRAMLISFTLFLMGISIPLIASYMNEEKYVCEKKEIIFEMNKIKEKVVIKLPDAPKAIEKKVPVYKPPVVVTNPEDTDSDLGELMKNAKNKNISDTNNSFVEIPDDTPKTKVLDDDNEIRPLSGISEMPEFPGGDEGRIKFLMENLKYPRLAVESGIQGKVILTFVIEKDGSITDIKLLRGIGAGCDEEASRVVTLMPKWNPGRQNGKEVRVQFNMPISFVLK
jgi:periplasmic protein TonB